jgi:oxygen-dependent protoporphyrinogen oxidase
MAPDVVVVGGGITGLATTHRLGQAGANVTLVEQSDRLGGIVQTTFDDGFVVEGGPDSFVTRKGSVLRLAEELGLASELISTRPDGGGSYVWWGGRLHPLPGGLLLVVPARLGPLFKSSLLSWRGKSRVLADLVLPRGGVEGDESLGSFVRRRLGSEALERIAEPLIAGIHAAEPDTMSLRASFPRFLEMEHRHRSLIVAARRAASRQVSTETRSPFSSFRLGMGQLVTALESAVSETDVRTGSVVTDIEEEGTGGYEVRLVDGTRIVAPAVVVATPAPIAARLLRRLAPEAAGTLSGITQTETLSVTLAYPTDRLPTLAGTGFVVPRAQHRRIRGVSYLSRKWAGRVPGPDHTLVRVFFGSDSDVTTPLQTAREELETMVGIRAEPTRHWIRAHRAGLHRYTLGHLERVATIEEALSSRPGVALAGAGLYGVGLNECVASGRNAAERVLETVGGRVDSGGGHQLG